MCVLVGQKAAKLIAVKVEGLIKKNSVTQLESHHKCEAWDRVLENQILKDYDFAAFHLRIFIVTLWKDHFVKLISVKETGSTLKISFAFSK